MFDKTFHDCILCKTRIAGTISMRGSVAQNHFGTFIVSINYYTCVRGDHH